MKAFNTIGADEVQLVLRAMDGPLSGYLAGERRGGYYVCALEEMWAETFHVKHAIACNSATSALLAAAQAIGLGPFDEFVVSSMTMSATAAAPMYMMAQPIFADVSDEDFGLVCPPMPDHTKAIFTTNLFGYPNRGLGQHQWERRKVNPIYLIEDNSQSPFAMAHGRYAGTMGDIGVWSLNVHKHIQCGEGGMLTTDDSQLAYHLRAIINHAENTNLGIIGLNLRMPEVCAAIALAQLRRGKEIVAGRGRQAEAVLTAIGDISGLRPPVIHPGCTHVYYTIPFVIRQNRAKFCAVLRRHGVPIVEGYVEPLHRLDAFKYWRRETPVADRLQDESLLYFENCAWDLTDDDIKRFGDAFRAAAKEAL